MRDVWMFGRGVEWVAGIVGRWVGGCLEGYWHFVGVDILGVDGFIGGRMSIFFFLV